MIPVPEVNHLGTIGVGALDEDVVVDYHATHRAYPTRRAGYFLGDWCFSSR